MWAKNPPRSGRSAQPPGGARGPCCRTRQPASVWAENSGPSREVGPPGFAPRVPNLLLPPSSKDGELGRGPTWAAKASSGERSLRDRSRLINSTFVRGPRAFKTDVGLFLLPPCPPRPWGASGDAALVSRKAPPAGRPHLRGGQGDGGGESWFFNSRELLTISL